MALAKYAGGALFHLQERIVIQKYSSSQKKGLNVES